MKPHWIENIRQKVTSRSIRLFSAPYLPVGLIWGAVLLAFTDLIVILLAQPAGFWITSNRAESSLPVLKSLLASGLGWYTLAGLVYLGLLGIALTLMTRSAALSIWLPLSFVHLDHSIAWLAGKILGTNPVESGLEPILVNAITGFILGIFLVAILLRPKMAVPPRRLVTWLRRGLPAAWVLALVGLVFFRAVWPKSGWQQIKPEHSPGYRASTALAYDPVRNRAVLFGGAGDWIGGGFMVENDTWEWNGLDWQEMKPEHSPSPRQGASMAYDAKHQVMVMFGGEDKSGTFMFGETWLWDGKDWKAADPQNSPPGRRGAQMFFDEETGKVILSGGFGLENVDTHKTQKSYADTWAWDGDSWQYVTSNEQPFVTVTSTTAYDPTRKRTVVFDTNRMLVWKAGSWIVANSTGLPQKLDDAALAINPGDGKMLVFGGRAGSENSNDTWLVVGDAWQKLSPDLAPGPRVAHAMFFDPTRKSYIIYGGANSYTLGDMWEFVLP